MLEMLERRDDALFDKFCDALTDTGQQHVVDLLKSQIAAGEKPLQYGNYGTATRLQNPCISSRWFATKTRKYSQNWLFIRKQHANNQAQLSHRKSTDSI